MAGACAEAATAQVQERRKEKQMPSGGDGEKQAVQVMQPKIAFLHHFAPLKLLARPNKAEETFKKKAPLQSRVDGRRTLSARSSLPPGPGVRSELDMGTESGPSSHGM